MHEQYQLVVLCVVSRDVCTYIAVVHHGDIKAVFPHTYYGMYPPSWTGP